jgi:hypothetical protein
LAVSLEEDPQNLIDGRERLTPGRRYAIRAERRYRRCDPREVEFESNFDISVHESEYLREISIRIEDAKMHYSVGRNPRDTSDLFLKSIRRQRFLDALFNRRDVHREGATLMAHRLLSGSESVMEPGWFDSDIMWKEPTPTPCSDHRKQS